MGSNRPKDRSSGSQKCPTKVVNLTLQLSKGWISFSTQSWTRIKFCRDLNPQPSDHESPPITTSRPGLPPYCAILFLLLIITRLSTCLNGDEFVANILALLSISFNNLNKSNVHKNLVFFMIPFIISNTFLQFRLMPWSSVFVRRVIVGLNPTTRYFEVKIASFG